MPDKTPKKKNQQIFFARNSPNGYGRLIHRNDREMVLRITGKGTRRKRNAPGLMS
jgi:bifunctional N-acetylglucosamine-1-phosphate-uridyltransferase/glucosamine-1-phosphate-acetyltransferase GlmU-like protein